MSTKVATRKSVTLLNKHLLKAGHSELSFWYKRHGEFVQMKYAICMDQTLQQYVETDCFSELWLGKIEIQENERDVVDWDNPLFEIFGFNYAITKEDTYLEEVRERNLKEICDKVHTLMLIDRENRQKELGKENTFICDWAII